MSRTLTEAWKGQRVIVRGPGVSQLVTRVQKGVARLSEVLQLRRRSALLVRGLQVR